MKRYVPRCKSEEEKRNAYNKMRRYCESIVHANGEIKRLYRFTGGKNWGAEGEGSGRLFSFGEGAQGLMRKLRGFLFDGTTTDIDMKNCHPVIMRYLCKKHKIEHAYLDQYIENRDDILSQFDDRDTAKTHFLSALNNQKMNKKVDNSFFMEFDKETKQIQKGLTKQAEYKNIVADVPENKQYNWNGSAINRILCFYENRILQVMMMRMNALNVEICAPMFDGVLVYGIQTQEVLEMLEAEIESAFPGLGMKLTIKEHCKDIVMPADFEQERTKELTEQVNRETDYSEEGMTKWFYSIYKENLAMSGGKLYIYDKKEWRKDDDKGTLTKSVIADVLLPLLVKELNTHNELLLTIPNTDARNTEKGRLD